MTKSGAGKIKLLLAKGVRIPNPGSIDIGAEVNLDRIAGQGVVLYPGSRIYGAQTLILDGAKIGYEAPATIDNCYVGPSVKLNGGFFSGAVFLEGSGCGSGAHVRAGTIFEEGARCAHTVGLKQTILFPWVTLGSLINFCDILMAGGTSARDHSEVGSSYIHFNYTPNQDKATASLLGDVPRGVMLDRPPIFLGGQGGLVGPCELTFGTTVSAGSICRKDEKKPGRLIIEGAARSGRVPFSTGVYRGVKRIVHHNVNYIANLLALRQWYLQVRLLFIAKRYPVQLAAGLEVTLDAAINERIRQFKKFCQKMPASIELLQTAAATDPPETLVKQQQELVDRLEDVASALNSGRAVTGDPGPGDRFLKSVTSAIQSEGKVYLDVIRALNGKGRETGTLWLQSIVDKVTQDTFRHLPSLA
jgi:UDP-N-acetylglucosamine/UDP-N-acetylgalactosamine diphosphorylase